MVPDGVKDLWRYLLGRLRGKTIVHALHVSKTGGTALKTALADSLTTASSEIFLHGHDFHLRQVSVGEKAVFFLRDPIDRFVSGFYSRQRQGRPRYNSPWSRDETKAFARFQTAKHLGRALSSEDADERRAARSAMKTVQHLNRSYYDWIESDNYFAARTPDILLVGFQETLTDDFACLKHLLGLPAHAALPEDAVAAHRNPETLDRHLDPVARANLMAWYRRDIALYQRTRKAAIDTLSRSSAEARDTEASSFVK